MDIRVRMNQVTVREMGMLIKLAMDQDDLKLLKQLKCANECIMEMDPEATGCGAGCLGYVLDLIEGSRAAVEIERKGHGEA